jgi:thiol-disulfide isomerase/thioredoxin
MMRPGLAAVLCGFVGLAGPGAATSGFAQESLVGRRLPPVNVGRLIQGTTRELGAWGDGKVYVLDLWGTWCAPCIKNIPALTRLQAAYRDRGLVVIGYSWERPEILEPFVRRMGDRMRYVVVADPAEVTLKGLTAMEAVRSFPYAFLIDRQGLVAWQGHPEDDDLAGAVARLFASPRKTPRELR